MLQETTAIGAGVVTLLVSGVGNYILFGEQGLQRVFSATLKPKVRGGIFLHLTEGRIAYITSYSYDILFRFRAFRLKPGYPLFRIRSAFTVLRLGA